MCTTLNVYIQMNQKHVIDKKMNIPPNLDTQINSKNKCQKNDNF